MKVILSFNEIDLYEELNLSSNNIVSNIRKLLKEYLNK